MHTTIIRPLLALIIGFSLQLTPPCRAAEFSPAPSLQGFTGLLNTPSALVTPEGRLDALFTNQIEDKWRGSTPRQENYLFSIGLFPFMELGGRVTEAPRVARDLSGNIKLSTAPLFADSPLLPVIAVGVQDIGGGSPFLRTVYAVASETIGPLRLSIGYGKGPDRMEGLFGGGELRAFDWLHLIGEYDTKETNVGLRLLTPPLPWLPLGIHATAKTSLDHRPDHPEFAIGFRMPLGSDHHAVAPIMPEPTAPPTLPASATKPNAEEPVPARPPATNRLSSLRRQLVSDGFLNVRIGVKGAELLVIEYENSRFNHNELDGMGVVLGRALASGQQTERLRLVLLKRGIRTLMLEAPTAKFAAFFADADARAALIADLRISPDITDDPALAWDNNAPDASNSLKAEAVLYPHLNTFVASDVGVFDYYLSLKTDGYLTLWPGAALNARFTSPLSWSENFDDGKEYRRFRNNRSFERLMLFQAAKVAPTLWLSASGGMILDRLYGTLNEAVWSPGDGSHRFRLKQMYAVNDETKGVKEVYLASYRYRYAPLDLSLEASAGRFYDRDRGFTTELKRFFGDTSFAVYYKNSRNAADERVEVGGITFTFPITPRRDMPSYPLRVRGTDEWGYSQETEIVSPGNGRNWVGRSIGLNPQVAYNIERVFQNRDRLDAGYIRQHLPRLRDAWLTYGEGK